MNKFTPWWLAWGAAFLVIETIAIRSRSKTPGGTLSSLVWRFQSKPWRHVLFVVAWAVLSAHFIFKFL